MSLRYAVDELVDVHIKGARVVEHSHPYLVVETAQADAMSVYADDPQVTVDRLWPASTGAPQQGDVWMDAQSRRYAAMRPHGEVEFVPFDGGAAITVEALRAARSPLTLIWREGWTAADVEAEPEKADKRTDQAQVVAGLRELADFIESHPRLPVKAYRANVEFSVLARKDAAGLGDVRDIARLLDVEPFLEDERGKPHPHATRKFSGGVTYRAYYVTEAALAGYPDEPAADVAPPAGDAGVEGVAAPSTPAPAPSFELGPVEDLSVAVTGAEDVAVAHGPDAPRHGYVHGCGDQCDNGTCPKGGLHPVCTPECDAPEPEAV